MEAPRYARSYKIKTRGLSKETFKLLKQNTTMKSKIFQPEILEFFYFSSKGSTPTGVIIKPKKNRKIRKDRKQWGFDTSLKAKK